MYLSFPPVLLIVFFFFFSSRRRHTRSKRDWSSDVCSSDLLGKLREALGSYVSGVYVENPNFFGRFEEQLQEIRDATKAIFVVGVNPIAQAIVRPPGDFGADIVIGEGQPLGTPMNFGG